MTKVGKGFSRVDTPLFEGMIVAQQADDVADEGAADVDVDDDEDEGEDDEKEYDEETMDEESFDPIPKPLKTVMMKAMSDKLCEEAQKENDKFLKTIDENMQNIIKEQVKEQVKKMEGNKSIQCFDEQRNLYKALVEAYESDKIILDTYDEIITLKRRRDNDADKDEEPSAEPDRGSKRRREGKEPESASAPTETATKSAGRSTQGSQSRQTSVSKSAFAEEPMQTTCQMEEPSHPEFDIGAEDQPIVQSSQHPEWFS
nr:hypothetical protein [Tanacetum cinerariifolium]